MDDLIYWLLSHIDSVTFQLLTTLGGILFTVCYGGKILFRTLTTTARLTCRTVAWCFRSSPPSELAQTILDALDGPLLVVDERGKVGEADRQVLRAGRVNVYTKGDRNGNRLFASSDAVDALLTNADKQVIHLKAQQGVTYFQKQMREQERDRIVRGLRSDDEPYHGSCNTAVNMTPCSLPQQSDNGKAKSKVDGKRS